MGEKYAFLMTLKENNAEYGKGDPTLALFFFLIKKHSSTKDKVISTR